MNVQEAHAIADAILFVSRKSGALRTTSATKTATAVRIACNQWVRTERAIVVPELRGVAPWASGEMKVLQLGKALGLVMAKLDVWKGKGEVLDAAAAIMATTRFGRGRQSFALTIGDHGGGAYAQELGAALADAEVAGYAIKALTAQGHGGFVDAVRSVGEASKVVWVQNAAKRYVEKFDGAAEPPVASGVITRPGARVITAKVDAG